MPKINKSSKDREYFKVIIIITKNNDTYCPKKLRYFLLSNR